MGVPIIRSNYQPPKLADPLETYGKALTLKRAMEELEQVRLENERLRAMTREVPETAAARRRQIEAGTRREESAEKLNLANLTGRQLENGIKRMNRFWHIASKARDQESYDRAVAAVRSEGLLTAEQLGQVPKAYDAAMVEQFRANLVSAKDQLEQARDARREQRLGSAAAGREEELLFRSESKKVAAVLGRARSAAAWESGFATLRRMGVREKVLSALPPFSSEATEQVRDLGGVRSASRSDFSAVADAEEERLGRDLTGDELLNLRRRWRGAGASPRGKTASRTARTKDGTYQWNPQTERYDIPVGAEAAADRGALDDEYREAYKQWRDAKYLHSKAEAAKDPVRTLAAREALDKADERMRSARSKLDAVERRRGRSGGRRADY